MKQPHRPKRRPAGSKLARRAIQGICTINDSTIMGRALTAHFYKKRFALNHFSIKVL